MLAPYFFLARGSPSTFLVLEWSVAKTNSRTNRLVKMTLEVVMRQNLTHKSFFLRALRSKWDKVEPNFLTSLSSSVSFGATAKQHGSIRQLQEVSDSLISSFKTSLLNKAVRERLLSAPHQQRHHHVVLPCCVSWQQLWAIDSTGFFDASRICIEWTFAAWL